ncbi:MAG: FecR domain-containing protein [Opitutae bacterium]|nr:FecR domain-containing protein [Opitutae bacterium]
MKIVPSLCFFALAASVLSASPLVLDRSTVTEVVNQVDRIAVPTDAVTPAAVQMELRAPDRLRTGRESRAELRAEDGTITRVGANTLFAFDPRGRELRLDRGSLLFHSPTGKGGGTIRTTSASATVLGTTLIAATTPDGGYKLLVLEGRAEVKFASGNALQLEAGQLTFVRPGAGGVGLPGPVVPFDLARQVKGSKLVQGFSRPLPSQARIDRAIQTQGKAVGLGRYVTTGFLVFAASSETQVSGIETAGPDADNHLFGEFTGAQRLALNTSTTLASATLPEARLFRTPLLVPMSESTFLNSQSDTLLTGLLADTLTITTPTLSLATWGGPADFQLVGKQRIDVTGSLRFTDLGNVSYLRFFSPRVNLPGSGIISATFTSARPGTFYFDTDETFTLGAVTFESHGGGVILQSHSGDVVLDGTIFHADAPIGADATVAGAVNLDARIGSVSVARALVDAPGGSFAISGASGVTIRQTSFALGGNFWADSGGPVTFDTLTFTAPAHSVFQGTGNDTLTARALDFRAFAEVNLGARTLVLESVHFAGGTTVRLVSENGLLAPNPNTGASALTGYVNFIRDVTYDGKPAQDYVPAAVGGTGAQPVAIQIAKPN